MINDVLMHNSILNSFRCEDFTMITRSLLVEDTRLQSSTGFGSVNSVDMLDCNLASAQTLRDKISMKGGKVPVIYCTLFLSSTSRTDPFKNADLFV